MQHKKNLRNSKFHKKKIKNSQQDSHSAATKTLLVLERAETGAHLLEEDEHEDGVGPQPHKRGDVSLEERRGAELRRVRDYVHQVLGKGCDWLIKQIQTFN